MTAPVVEQMSTKALDFRLLAARSLFDLPGSSDGLDPGEPIQVHGVAHIPVIEVDFHIIPGLHGRGPFVDFLLDLAGILGRQMLAMRRPHAMAEIVIPRDGLSGLGSRSGGTHAVLLICRALCIGVHRVLPFVPEYRRKNRINRRSR